MAFDFPELMPQMLAKRAMQQGGGSALQHVDGSTLHDIPRVQIPTHYAGPTLWNTLVLSADVRWSLFFPIRLTLTVRGLAVHGWGRLKLP